MISKAREKLKTEGLYRLFVDGFLFLIHSAITAIRVGIYKYRQRNSFSVESNNITVDLSYNSVSYEVGRQIRNGTYEKTECSLIREYLPEECPVIELGAGIGYTSCLIDSCLSDSVQHLSVEANEQLVPILQCTRELNNSNFEIINMAYAPNDDRVNFEIDENFTASKIRSGGSNENTVVVPGASIRQLCAEYDISFFSLVADIEGSEFDLVEEELDFLSSWCRFLIIEVHPNKNRTLEQFSARMTDAGFECIASAEDVFAFRNTSV